jgi:hypothetical protein
MGKTEEAKGETMIEDSHALLSHEIVTFNKLVLLKLEL